jgi:hypothetical protein
VELVVLGQPGTLPEPERRKPALRPWRDVADSSDPLGVVGFATHHLPLEEAPRGYDMFRDKTDGCIKVVLQP